MIQTKPLNNIVSKLLLIVGVIGFVILLIYPVSSEPGYALGGIVLTVLAVLWMIKGIIVYRLK